MTTTDIRINDLEIRMAHQDQTIADLNDDGWLDVYCANDFVSNGLSFFISVLSIF